VDFSFVPGTKAFGVLLLQLCFLSSPFPKTPTPTHTPCPIYERTNHLCKEASTAILQQGLNNVCSDQSKPQRQPDIRTSRGILWESPGVRSEPHKLSLIYLGTSAIFPGSFARFLYVFHELDISTLIYLVRLSSEQVVFLGRLIQLMTLPCMAVCMAHLKPNELVSSPISCEQLLRG